MQRLRDREDDIVRMWYLQLETLKSYQVDKLKHKCLSNVAGDHPHYSDDHMLVTEENISDSFKDPDLTSEKHKIESYRIDPLEYSQLAPLEERGPSQTSTTMARHTCANVYPESKDEKVTIKETEKDVWRVEFKSITSEIVLKTNAVLRKTLNKHDQYTNRSKDLLDEEFGRNET